MENITKEFKEVNNDMVINENTLQRYNEEVIEFNPFSMVEEQKDTSISNLSNETPSEKEQELITKKVKENILKAKIKQATDKELGVNKNNKPAKIVKQLTEAEIIEKKVKANIIKEKVKKASKILIDKINPPIPKKEYVVQPTIESVYLDRTMNDGKTPYIDNFKRDAGNIFQWTSEYWKLQNPDDIKADITEWLKRFHDTDLSSKNVNSIFNVFYFKMKTFDTTPIKDLYIPTKKYWLKVDQSTGDITAILPSKDIALKYQINVVVNKLGAYTPTETALNSLFNKFISSSLPEADKQALVQEYSGYTLTTDTAAQKFMFWIGDGGNGKSVLVEMLAAINPSSVSTKMENIGLYNDNFIGKSLIFATETKKKAFDTEMLKAAVSGDTVELRGIRKEKQSVKMIAKWIILGNNDFRIDDFSNGLFRRMIIVNWNVSFNNSKNEIKDLAQQILNTEMDILLNWCLIGLQRLIKNKLVFSKCEDSEKALFNFKNNADKVRMFANDYQFEYSTDKTKFLTKEEIFEKFDRYTNKNGYEKLNAVNFWKRMANIYPEIEKDIKDEVKKNGKRIVYLGIKLTAID